MMIQAGELAVGTFAGQTSKPASPTVVPSRSAAGSPSETRGLSVVDTELIPSALQAVGAAEVAQGDVELVIIEVRGIASLIGGGAMLSPEEIAELQQTSAGPLGDLYQDLTPSLADLTTGNVEEAQTIAEAIRAQVQADPAASLQALGNVPADHALALLEPPT
jgi:hypothetical protein